MDVQRIAELELLRLVVVLSAEADGLQLVLTAAANLLWFDATVDITDEVIAALRATAGNSPGGQPAD